MKSILLFLLFMFIFSYAEATSADCMLNFQMDMYNAETTYENCNQGCNLYAGSGFPEPQYCYWECDAAFARAVETAANSFSSCCCFSGSCPGFPCG